VSLLKSEKEREIVFENKKVNKFQVERSFKYLLLEKREKNGTKVQSRLFKCIIGF